MKIQLFIVLAIVACGLWSCGGRSGGNTVNPAFTGACAQLPAASPPDFNKRLTDFVEQSCYTKRLGLFQV